MCNALMKIKRVDIRKQKVQAELSALQKRCLPHDIPFKTDKGFWWIVYDSFDNACAFGGLVPSMRWSDCGYLCRSGVLPLYRGKGIQKKLIRARVRQARALGWRWLITDTYENPPSSNSLISCGFRLFEPTVPWGANGTLYWRLQVRD